MTASTAIVQVRADPAMRGRVLALQAIVFLGSTPIGGPLLGAICDAYGARAGLVVGGASALGAALFGSMAMRRNLDHRAALEGPNVPPPTSKSPERQTVMTTLPRARPSCTCRMAAAVSLSG